MFISNAYAAGATGGLESMFGDMNVLLLVVMVAVMYFVMIRPQMKRQKELKAMMDALAKGDEVVTSGGLLGKIIKVADVYVTLEVGSSTEVIIQRSAISQLLPKGTIKSV